MGRGEGRVLNTRARGDGRTLSARSAGKDRVRRAGVRGRGVGLSVAPADGCRGLARRLPALVLLIAFLPVSAAAQDPPDSLAAARDSLQDSTRVDSLATDSLGADSLAADSTAAADSLPPPPVLPSLPDPAPEGFLSGIRDWDRDELMGARAQTLWELLSDIPGLIAVRSGDYGAAATVFPIGYSGGGLRLYYDGVEHLPLEGTVPDLSRIPLSGLGGVRVIRRPGGLEVHLTRLDHADRRPMTLIEAGTGDLDTNLLRATFSFPRALRGKTAVALERLDTEGRDTPGAVTGGWFRYSLHRGDRAGLTFEARRMSSERDVFTEAPGSVSRTDWTVQGRWTPVGGFLAEAWRTGASVAAGDSLEAFPYTAESRGQTGLRLSAGRGGVWGRAAARFNGGEGIVDRELTAELSAVSGRWGGIAARAREESWDEQTGSSFDMSVWVTPISHAALFAEHGGGTRSVPFLKPLPPPVDSTDVETDTTTMGPDTMMIDPDSVDAGPRSRFTDRGGTRLGVRLSWREVQLTGAMVAVEADSIWPTQLLFDRGGLVLPQPRRQGLEVTARVPLWPDGLFFLGEVQLWETEDSAAIGSLYFPEHQYRGSLTFHRRYFPTGNFELWVDVGARGRAEMKVPQPHGPPGPALPATGDDSPGIPSVVPFYQDWYFRLQMRVLNLNIFATIENVTYRQNNQDVPGRLLPITRGFYGVRWAFWN